jgi:hypothetical protein
MRQAERVVAALCILLGCGIIWQAWGMDYLKAIANEEHLKKMEDQIKLLMGVAKEE